MHFSLGTFSWASKTNSPGANWDIRRMARRAKPRYGLRKKYLAHRGEARLKSGSSYEGQNLRQIEDKKLDYSLRSPCGPPFGRSKRYALLSRLRGNDGTIANVMGHLKSNKAPSGKRETTPDISHPTRQKTSSLHPSMRSAVDCAAPPPLQHVRKILSAGLSACGSA